MNKFSDWLVKAGGAVGRMVAVGLVLPAAALTARQGAEGIEQAIAMLEAAEEIGQALGEVLIEEMPNIVWALAMWETIPAGAFMPAAMVMVRVWKVLKGGEARQRNRDYTMF